MCVCVWFQVHFNDGGPGHRRHEQEGAAGDPEEVGLGSMISLEAVKIAPTVFKLKGVLVTG